MTENTAGKQRGKPFKKGQSGNPAGKPKGTRHKTALLAEKLMSDDVEAIVKAVVDAAKSGDLTAAKIVLDRIAPARRDNPVRFELPAIESPADAAKASGGHPGGCRGWRIDAKRSRPGLEGCRRLCEGDRGPRIRAAPRSARAEGPMNRRATSGLSRLKKLEQSRRSFRHLQRMNDADLMVLIFGYDTPEFHAAKALESAGDDAAFEKMLGEIADKNANLEKCIARTN